jgi:hypothetical protein
MEPEKEIKVLLALLKVSEDLNREYEKELRRLRINNLRLRLHMEVLVKTPSCRIVQKIRTAYGTSADFSESILHLN